MNIAVNITHEGKTYERVAVTGYGNDVNYFFDEDSGEWIPMNHNTNISIYIDNKLKYSSAK